MEHTHSREAKTSTASQVNPSTLWKAKVHYCIHQPLLPVPTPFMPPYPTSSISILILSSHLCLGLPSGISPSGVPTKILYKPLFHSPIRATCSAHLVRLNLVTRIIFREEACTNVNEKKKATEQNMELERTLHFDGCEFFISPIKRLVPMVT